MLLDNFKQIGINAIRAQGLRRSFVFLLSEIENIKGNLRLGDIFDLIGQEMKKNDISTLITVINEKNQELVMRHISVIDDDEKLMELLKIDTNQLRKIYHFEDLLKNRKSIYSFDRKSEIASVLGGGLDERARNEKSASIITPLILKGEIIGTLELLSKRLDRKDVPLIEDFVSRLVANITSNLLFSEIRQSEKRYRHLFQNSSEGIVFFSIKNKVYREANKAMEKISGYSREELSRNHYLRIFFVEERPALEKMIKSVCENGGQADLPYMLCTKLRTKNGETKICELEIGLQAGGEELYFSFDDVTEEKNMEIALKESEERYRMLVDNAAEGVLSYDVNGKINFANRALLLMLEGTKKQIVGQKVDQFIYSEDRDFVMDRFRERVSGFKVISDYDFRVRTIRGNIRFVNYNGVLVMKEGKVVGVQATIRDISEKKRDEEEKRRLVEFNQKILDSSPVSIVVLDKQGKMVSSNVMAKQLLKNEFDNLAEAKLTETAAIKNNQELCAKYGNLLASGESFTYDKLSFISKKSGRKKFFNIIAVPLFDEHGHVDGAISMAIDDTEKVLAKQRLEKMNDELEGMVRIRTDELDQANKELSKVLELKSKFISDASHELRTPLTIIQGNLDLYFQERFKQKEERPEALSVIAKEVEQMTDILSDLTMLTNTDASSETINYDVVDLNLLVTAVVQSLRILATQKRIHIKEVLEEENLEIVGDENKLEKLLKNIVRNAIKYTENDGYIEVRCRRSGGMARLIVRDTGIGIPENDLPYIFERFYRVDKARSRKEGGTGLGLSICKWIVEAHGGHIGVESKLGTGSVFTVDLPIIKKEKK